MEQNSTHKLDSFYFIINAIDADLSTPIELIDGHYLRRPADDEILKIRESLGLLSPSLGRFGPFLNIYEEGLSREKWRYAIISFRGVNTQQQMLADCLSLLTPSIEMGFSVTYSKSFVGDASALGYNAESFSAYSNLPPWHRKPVTELSLDSLARIRSFVDLISTARSNHSVEAKSLDSFRNIKHLPRMSDAAILLSFAIIESLITHNPKLTDKLDSIKHQVSSKMILLNKKFYSPSDGSKYFDTFGMSSKPKEAEKKMWSMLYDFRSAIAHGSEVDMDKVFSRLKSRESISQFLDDVLKQLITLGLTESAFLEDLRGV